MHGRLVAIGLAVALSVGGAIAIQGGTNTPTDTEDPEAPGHTEEPSPNGDDPVAPREAGPGIIAYGDEMPTSTGWFVIPLLADEPTPVHVEFRPKLDNTDDQAKMATPILLQHDDIYTSLFAAGQDKSTSLHVEDRTVDCCTARFDGEDGRADLSGWYGTAPEAPLYVGLAAAGWSEGDNVTIRAYGQRAEIRMGPTITGTNVQAVNLFEHARENPHVRVRDHNMVGGHEDVELEWTARNNALVVVRWDLDEARADLQVTMPNGTAVGNMATTETRGWISAAGGPGDVLLSFADAGRESPRDGEVYALFADVRVPYETLESWQP